MSYGKKVNLDGHVAKGEDPVPVFVRLQFPNLWQNRTT